MLVIFVAPRCWENVLNILEVHSRIVLGVLVSVFSAADGADGVNWVSCRLIVCQLLLKLLLF